MRRIRAQLDIGLVVRRALRETQPAAHLQARPVVDHDLDPRAPAAPGPFFHQRAGQRGTETLCLMLGKQCEVDELDDVGLIVFDEPANLLAAEFDDE
jgi:hypothetical protein